VRFAYLFAISFTSMITFACFAKSAPTNPAWLEFQKDSKSFMDRLPPKLTSGSTGEALPFSKSQIDSREFILRKSDIGPQAPQQGVCAKGALKGLCGKNKNSFAAWGWVNTDVENFVNSRDFVHDLAEMDAKNLHTAHLSETPWSSSYWPTARGGIGNRYASGNFYGYAWKDFYDLVKGPSSLKAIYDSGRSDDIDGLSPSEKYDLLIGQLSTVRRVYENGFLTPAMWKEGKRFYDSTGDVESWMGICHGWSPASFMVPRPRKVVATKAADSKTTLRFYPSDLKALTSYLWSLDLVPTHFLGQRCNQKNPDRDPESGRVLDERCFDTNPGIWHLAIVNQIGVAHHSFVMDATYDYEVWNQPVYGYSYNYFNADTGVQEDRIEDAVVKIGDLKNDKFKKFRSPRAVYVVGVVMQVTYVSETRPTHDEIDSPEKDLTTTVSYMYDLELDAAMKIIGGEWYQNAHPDFLWTPAANSHASSYGDAKLTDKLNVKSADQPTAALGGWTPGEPLPAFWREIAVNTAIHYGQPLAGILDALVKEASMPDVKTEGSIDEGTSIP
jgi:hypothetical protein